MNDKHLFQPQDSEPQPEKLKTKREFHPTQVELDQSAYQEEGEMEQQLQQAIQRPLSWWQKGLIGTVALFGAATIAQAIQWLVDAWQQHQWINFAFALVFAAIVVFGVSAVVKEFRQLRQLKKLAILQQQSQHLQLNSPISNTEDSTKLTKQLLNYMQISPQQPRYQQWQQYANQGYNASELLKLFSEEFLHPLDQQAQKIVNKQALEATMIVAVSPLALVDMAFVAWRHLRLINKLAALYGVKLGYFSRIRLIRMVLFNIAFAGATDVIRDIGMDWLSQDLTAKLSARVAQGIGVGLLTARLGIKTMEFCRPVPFTAKEKPRLHTIHKLLIAEVKNVIKDNILKTAEKAER
ncbi:YcjF family protein [Gallibacterium anatis]|uniref:YcjF family protein n=1 Tax=Gallibacterium anatis TaxID=750 RepID=UPI000B9FCE95|nr:TIGR01620 family protein [Gallibacterium anatis]WAX72085.1 TIGR01620 family protein [Gallibacterium anatis]